uniref:Uncharacterized protein LOC102805886 n=1 Tax=Saccoglossus kowalevskii TaxID=10224 RepID=A0ABM0M4V1_SACKO
WKTCEVYESVKDSPARQEHTLVKKSHPPPVAPRPALKPKPNMMVRVAAPPTDSESDHSSLERNKKGNDVYAMVSKKEHKKKSKRGAPEKSSSSSLSDPSIPPPLPEITSKRLESNETSSDSDGKAELATTKKPKRRSLRRSQKQIVESGTPSDEQLPGMYDDYPARVRVLPPSAHEDIENEDVTRDEDDEFEALAVTAWRCIALAVTAWRCIALAVTAWGCIALAVTAWRCIALAVTAWRCIALAVTAWRCIALAVTAWRCIALL